MRLVRMTTRRWMVVVVIVGLLMGVIAHEPDRGGLQVPLAVHALNSPDSTK